MEAAARVAYGDWQTPWELADHALSRVLSTMHAPPRTVIEPTCGKGAFLVAAARRLPEAEVIGYEINRAYAELAASRLEAEGVKGRVRHADFFSIDWDREVAELRAPVLVIGNPPWVTSADLGAMGSGNLPIKQNIKGLRGMDARTGKGNFDVSEWMILRLLGALAGREATLAVLCKSAVARRVVEVAGHRRWPFVPGALWRIDAARHFDASVDAVLFTCRLSAGASGEAMIAWPVYPSLSAAAPERALGVVGGALVADLDAYTQTRGLAGASRPAWRSGIKHDCARVMELERRGSGWVNGVNGEVVDVEAEHRYPLLKGSDVVHGRSAARRAVIVPQRALGEDTTLLETRAPKLWAYLMRHRGMLDGRKSAIYRGQPPFAIFGVGEYSFAPWKVAISGLHKRVRFLVVGPWGDRPVMVDDTCYFLPFATEAEARRAASALSSELGETFFRGRVFWDAKRPISKSILQALDLDRLLVALGDGAGA